MAEKKSFRAIVIEDDSSWQQILSEILTDCGLAVDVAGNLEDAQQILKREPHRLALVDLSLEGSDHHNEDGLRALESIRRVDPDCQAILLTGFATVELAVSVLTEFGAFSFLRKENFNRAQFRELIHQALTVAPRISPAVDDGQTQKSIAEPRQQATDQKRGAALVVEDDAGWRSILSELLADDGLEPRVCASYGDALGALRRETFALAVIDLSLNGELDWSNPAACESLEGTDLLANTRAAGIPTIVVSGIVAVDEIQRAYNEHSVFAYLEKQAFDRINFKQLVREALKSFPVHSELRGFTLREREVYELLARGMSNKEIAEALVITNNTVKRHLKVIFGKLGVHSRAAAISKASGKK